MPYGILGRVEVYDGTNPNVSIYARLVPSFVMTLSVVSLVTDDVFLSGRIY